MNIFLAMLFGLVQGLTEFIPISSSGHLLLMHRVFGTGGNELAFDVALHFGTLLALIAYFYKDLWQLFLGLLGKNNQKKLAWLLVLATVPAVIVGMILQDAAESTFRSAGLVATTMLLAGLLMFLAEYVAKRYKTQRDLSHVTVKEALAVGAAQAVALVPGVSRSGATITTGLFVGMERVAATRFSFLLGIPITAGAIAKVMLDGDTLSQVSAERAIFVAGVLSACVGGILAIRFMLRYLAKHSLAVFAWYRIGLATLVFTILLLS